MKWMETEDYKKIDDNKFVIVKYYFNQYAWGITGSTKHEDVYSPINGWNTQKEAKQYALDNKFTRRTVKGVNEGYGEVGAIVERWWVVRKKNITDKLGRFSSPRIFIAE